MAENDVMNTDETLEPVEVVHDLPVERSLLGATLGATAAEEQEPDEEFETIPVAELLEVKLGRQGENDTQTVVIDCSAWLTQLPGCTLMIAATRPGEREIYLPEVTVSNGVVTWPILEQDTACAGTGRAEVRAMKDGKVKKSALFRTRVEPALEGDGSPDAPTPPNWVRLIIESVAASQEAAEHAESLVEEATACAINAVRFDEDQGLTEAQKATGRGNIDAVGLKQGAANAGKVLLVGADGNVTLGDAVQIDATLQQAGQAADAAAAGAALQGKVAVVQGVAHAGKALVVGADGRVTLGVMGLSAEVSAALLALLRHVAYAEATGRQYYDALYEALTGEAPAPGPDPQPEPVSDFTVYSGGAADYFTSETPVDNWVDGYFTDSHAARVALVAQSGTHPMTDTGGNAMSAYPIPIPSGTQILTISELDSIYIINCAIYRYDATVGKWKRRVGEDSTRVIYQDERTVDLSDYSDGSYACVVTIAPRSSYSEGVPAPYSMNDTAHRIDNVDFSGVTLEFDSEAPAPVGPVVVNAVISPCEVSEYFSADTPDGEGWYNAYYDAKNTYVGRTAAHASTGDHPMTSTEGDAMNVYPIPIPSGATTLTVTGLDSDLEYAFIAHKYDATAQHWKRRANDASSLWKLANVQVTDISAYGDGTYFFTLNIAKYSGSQGSGSAGSFPQPYGYTASAGDISGRDMSGVTITIGFDAE